MDSKEAMEILGITRWHELGYKGEGVKVMAGEEVYEKDYPNVISPGGFETNSKHDHGTQVMDCLIKVIPNAEIYAYRIAGTGDNFPCLDYILANNITLFGTSSGYNSKLSKGQEDAMQKCIDNGTTFFCAAGNSSEEGLTGYAKSDKYLAIGAATLKNGKFVRASYSAIGEEIDYMGIPFTMWTSFTQPVFTGMCALVQQFFKQKIGRYLKRDELIKFIDDNVTDLQEKGEDDETGKGLFILPEPSEIDIKKYIGDDFMKELLLTIGSKKILVDGVEKEIDVAPFLQNNRTFVPIYTLRELGLQVEWLESTRQVKVTSQN